MAIITADRLGDEGVVVGANPLVAVVLNGHPVLVVAFCFAQGTVAVEVFRVGQLGGRQHEVAACIFGSIAFGAKKAAVPFEHGGTV